MTSFAAVFSDPDDDGAREVLADALQEKGDPHGTLIALQMMLARLAPDDDDERERLSEEIEAHLAEHGDRIREALGVRDVTCWFVRGFPEEIELTAKQLATRIARITERSPVRRLRITHTSGGSHNLRIGLPLLAGTTVRSIKFPHATLADEIVDIFEKLELALDSLDVWLDVEPAARLLRTPSFRALRSLRVAYTSEPRGLLEDLPETLEELALDVQWHPSTIDALARAPFAERLRSLSLVNGSIGDEALARLLPALKNIRSLDLSACKLRSAAPFAHAKNLDRLEVLRLSSNALEADAIASLFRIEHLANLRELRLGELPVGIAGLRALASSGWRSVAHLGLGHTQLGPEAMRHLAGWLPPSIRVLELHHNRLTDEGVELLTRSPNTAHLRELGLSLCDLGDGALTALAGARLDALRTLDLGFNPHIGEPGCLALAGSKSLGRLRLLDFHGVRSGRAGGRALRTRFGQAVVR